MTILRVQHSFQGASGIAKDQYVNTFYFSGTTIDAGDPTALASTVKGFYASVPTGRSNSIASKMQSLSDAAGAKVKIYNMADAEPRVPIYQEEYTPASHGSGGGNNLPTELAVCLSYHGALESGVPVGRRRGRIYLGPWTVNALETSTTISAHVDGQLSQDIIAAAEDLAAQSATLGWSWSVHSTVGGFATPITVIHVDNAWDIQRRRGDAANNRFTATI